MFEKGGLRGLGSRCGVFGGPGVALFGLAGQRGGEEPIEALLKDYPADVVLLRNDLSEKKTTLVLSGR